MVHSPPHNQGLKWLIDLRRDHYIGRDGLEYCQHEVEHRIIELSQVLGERLQLEADREARRQIREAKNAAKKERAKFRKPWRKPNKSKVNKNGQVARKGA